MLKSLTETHCGLVTRLNPRLSINNSSPLSSQRCIVGKLADVTFCSRGISKSETGWELMAPKLHGTPCVLPSRKTSLHSINRFTSHRRLPFNYSRLILTYGTHFNCRDSKMWATGRHLQQGITCWRSNWRQSKWSQFTVKPELINTKRRGPHIRGAACHEFNICFVFFPFFSFFRKVYRSKLQRSRRKKSADRRWSRM